MPTLGKFIQRRRMELGLTQEQLAAMIDPGVRQSEISRLEHDRISLPRRQRLEKIASALDVSLGELLVRSGWAEADQSLATVDSTSIASVEASEVGDDSETLALSDAIARAERLIANSDQIVNHSQATYDLARRSIRYSRVGRRSTITPTTQ